jgi:hypothetical protein
MTEQVNLRDVVQASAFPRLTTLAFAAERSSDRPDVIADQQSAGQHAGTVALSNFTAQASPPSGN